MKNNLDTRVSIKFITIMTTIVIAILATFMIYKAQKDVELSDLVEKTTNQKIALNRNTVTSRSMTTSRIKTSNENTQTTTQNEAQTIEKVQVAAKKAINEEEKYISISEVKISKNMDLTSRTELSKEDFITLIAGVKADTSGFFKENAGTIYDLCKKYQINEIFFCGLISAESGWNIASNHRRTHNYISLMSKGKLISFTSVNEGLEAAAKTLHNNYLTPGGKLYHGKTLSGVKTRFCPASSTWVDLVYGRMKQII